MNFANQVKNTLLQDIANMANVSWFFSKHPETDFTRNPQDPETYFPPDGKTTNGYNQVHLVALFDLLSRRFTDCTVQPIRKKNEFLALTQMIDRCDLPDAVPIFIADRGFHSFNVFAHAIEHNAYFLIRAKDVNMRRLLGQDIPDASFSTAEIKSLYGHLFQAAKTFKHFFIIGILKSNIVLKYRATAIAELMQRPPLHFFGNLCILYFTDISRMNYEAHTL